jgi:hypothetical protein
VQSTIYTARLISSPSVTTINDAFVSAQGLLAPKPVFAQRSIGVHSSATSNPPAATLDGPLVYMRLG